MKKYRRIISRDTDEWCKVWRKTGSWLQKWHYEFGKFYTSSGKSENLHFVLLLSIAYKVSAKKCSRVISHDTEEWSKPWRKTHFLFGNDMNNLANFSASSGKSENLHVDGMFLSKVCNVWAKKIETSCVVKNDLRFQKWHKKFGSWK